MHASLRRFMAVLLTCLLVTGCAAPQATNTTAPSSATAELTSGPVGTPWKDWFVKGVLTKDDAIRPQDDYYTAANRDYILKANEAAEDEASATYDRENEMIGQMASLLEGHQQASDESQVDLNNLRALYDLYQDWDGRNAKGIVPIKPIYQRLRDVKTLDDFSSWICSDDHRLSMQWTEESVSDEEGYALFTVSMYNDIDDKTGEISNGYVVSFAAPSLLLASTEPVGEGTTSDEDLVAYSWSPGLLENARYMLRRLGMNDEETEQTITDAVKLETLLYDNSDAGLDDYDELTFQQLAAKSKNGFPLDRIIQAYGYTDAKYYAIENTVWLEALNKLYTSKNLNLFVSHELVVLAMSNAKLLDRDAYDANGVPSSAEEQRDAMNAIEEALPTSYAKTYVENFYDESITAEVENLVRRVVSKYEEMIAEEDWLSESTKQYAIEKLNSIRACVGYPTKWSDTSNIKVTSSKDGGVLFEEVRKLNDAQLKQQADMLRHPDKEGYWSDFMEANAHYREATNSIYLGVGTLGGVFYPKDATEEQILGGIGTIIGHEISHAFDDYGAMFDKNGVFKNWWTDADKQAFDTRVQRVQDAFETIDPLGVGPYYGSAVCSEAIADLAGMKVVLRLAAENPDCDYAKLFEAYAATWADCVDMDLALDRFDFDTHPLDRDRVNMVVREADEFVTAYDIKDGDGMYLAEKNRISVW